MQPKREKKIEKWLSTESQGKRGRGQEKVWVSAFLNGSSICSRERNSKFEGTGAEEKGLGVGHKIA